MAKRTTANKRPRKIAVMTITIPDHLWDRAADALGSGIAEDPDFWTIALRTGIDELARQFQRIEADSRKAADKDGHIVIFGSPAIIDLDDDLPF